MPPRIVSLLPSATESLCAIDGESLLVGRSHECDYPLGISEIPALTAPAIKPERATNPGAIDAEVRRQMSSGQSLYSVNEKLLADLKPDLILTQDLCEVCSIDLKTVRRIAETLSPRPEIVSLNPQTFEGVLDDLYTIGRAAGLESQAVSKAADLRERMFAAAEFVNALEDGPNVVLLEWTDPLFVGGHWTPQLIERAGARHPLNPTVAKEEAGAAAGPQMAERLAGKSIRVDPEIVGALNPDAIIIAPCGMDLATTRTCADALLKQEWFQGLKAVREGRVAIVDGNQMFNRPGPRLVDAFEFLVGWLNNRAGVIPIGFPWTLLERP
ncbi:MAG: ABC transporter substrate-binding protein [Phycisphaeraceae bacterium]|nr:ABC transporter substrate-binding protein [Phycisphaeraceae bacterium]